MREPQQPGESALDSGRAATRVEFAIGLILVAAAGLAYTAYYAHMFGIPFADTYTYLDPWRNWMQGRGFVTRFNVVHGWSGQLDHPALAYYNPLFGLPLALAWSRFEPAWVAVIMTALPCCANAVLLAVLVQPAFGTLTALLSAAGYLLMPATAHNLVLISVDPAAVTVLLVCLIVIQYRTATQPRAWTFVGIMLGLAYLCKVTLVLAIPGLIAAIVLSQAAGWRQAVRASVQPIALLLTGLTVVVLPYITVARLATGEFYPSYPAMAQNWSLATTYGGRYVHASPAVRPDAERVPDLARRVLIVLQNIGAMLRATAGDLGPLLLFIVAGIRTVDRSAKRLAIFLVSVGASFAAGHALAFNWISVVSEPRYGIYISPFWYPVAIWGLVRTLGAEARAWRALAVVACWLLASGITVLSDPESFWRAPQLADPRSVRLRHTMDGVAGLVGPDDLVAVQGGGLLISAAVFLERPVVSLPEGVMATHEALREFLGVFQPALVVPAQTQDNFRRLETLGYAPRRVNDGRLMVFVRTP